MQLAKVSSLLLVVFLYCSADVPECSFIQGKVKGCILGAALGDALGAPVEFIKSYDAIKKAYPPAGITGIESLKQKDFTYDKQGKNVMPYTDDTAMSFLVIESLVLLDPGYSSCIDAMGSIARAFAKDMENPWGWTRPSRAPGIASCKNVNRIKEYLAQGYDKKNPATWWQAGGAKDGGCGSVMHAHPFGLFFAHDLAKAELWAVEHSKITHGAPIALAACAAMAVGVAQAFNGVEPAHVAQAMHEVAMRYDQETADKIARAIAYALDASISSQKVFEEFLGWAAHDAIAATVYIFLKHPDDLPKAILLGVNTPGDSDSIASMAGALVGARVGISQIPAAWLAPLEGKEKLEQLSNALTTMII